MNMQRYIFDDGCIEHSRNATDAHGEAFYLVSDVDAALAERDRKLAELEKALRYYRDEVTGNEPSVSVYASMSKRTEQENKA